ncbi:histidine phosphatase family protein [Swingsia samuiensis]|uniref:Phosphoglycerate mutase n=1 Tax=Swingsia samuiensis TaxID=1293412 RepID=A0A4Y6UMY0_9PROT|nr:histidine phosphatase family protein [Swingsia samuiensis]QDH17741.1 phosphoglycerate mutase [Swingsia samuiensis]
MLDPDLNRVPLLLVRHPEVLNGQGVCYGRQEMDLVKGWEQKAHNLLEYVLKYDFKVIYSSPAQRCALLANFVAKKAGIDLKYDARLQELDFGEWEGTKWEDVPRVFLDEWAATPETFQIPGGENLQDLRVRVFSFWEECISHFQISACVISHGGPLRLLCALAEKKPLDVLAPSLPQGGLRLFWPNA